MYSLESAPDGTPLGRDSNDSPAAPRDASIKFGSPGTDSTVRRLDLNDALIRHPEATFLMRAAGNAMRDAGIDDGDVLIVDRALPARHGSVVIASVAGELYCRRLHKQGGALRLQAADPAHADIVPSEERPVEFWGVVTTVIRSLLA
jgi:DNA polymerase V